MTEKVVEEKKLTVLSDAVKIALITAIAPTLFSAAALVAALNATAKVETVVTKVEEIHIATNSMKDALVKATKDAALLTGHAEGVKDEKVRAADANKKE